MLIYELVGGEKKIKGEVKRWFKPVNELGEIGNSILCRGLQGSPLFRNGEHFLENLRSAIQSEEGELRRLPALGLGIRAKDSLRPDADEVIKKFDRETRRVSTAILAAVVFASIIVAVLVPERYSKLDDLAARQAGRDFLSTANFTNHFSVMGLNQRISAEKTIPRLTNDAVTDISLPANVPSQVEAEAQNPSRIVDYSPAMNRQAMEVNAGFGTLAHQRDSVGIPGTKVIRARSRISARARFVSLKTRLLQLWHQSLIEGEKSRGWPSAANSSKADRKKISYTAETNH